MNTSRATRADQARNDLWNLIENRLKEKNLDVLSTQLIQLSKQWTVSTPKVMEISSEISKLGKSLRSFHLIKNFAERSTSVLHVIDGSMTLADWMSDTAIRVWLLAEGANACSENQDPYQSLFTIYDRGETEVKIACLYALNFVTGEVSEGLKLIHDAGRTYLPRLLAAAWSGNPFSGCHLSTEAFRKAVMKALFCDVPIENFYQLEDRVDETLARRLNEFADEREAAGRDVPTILWRLSAKSPQPGLVARMIGRLEHPLESERLSAAVSLGLTMDHRALSFLQDRINRERSASVQDALNQSIMTLSE